MRFLKRAGSVIGGVIAATLVLGFVIDTGSVNPPDDAVVYLKPGKSGNPKGRPRGLRNKRTLFREAFESHSQALLAKCVQMALEGDKTALRLCIDRIIPAVRPASEPIKFRVRKGTKPCDAILAR